MYRVCGVYVRDVFLYQPPGKGGELPDAGVHGGAACGFRGDISIGDIGKFCAISAQMGAVHVYSDSIPQHDQRRRGYQRMPVLSPGSDSDLYSLDSTGVPDQGSKDRKRGQDADRVARSTRAGVIYVLGL